MNNLNKNLAYSLKWLSLESISYNAIFLAHQALLFKFTGAYVYGIISVIFSIIYLATTISTFGLEASLSPFFNQIMLNKKAFKRFFFMQFSPILFLSSLYIPILIFCKNQNLYFKSLNFLNKLLPSNPALQKIFHENITYTFIFTIFALILSESLKKPLRGLLYLTLKNKKNMALEVGSILIYVAAIWAVYAITGNITLNLIFIPLAVTSVVSSIILLFFTYKIYSVLPEDAGIIASSRSITKILTKISSIKNISSLKNAFKQNLFKQNIISFIKNIFANIFIKTQKNIQYKIFKMRTINFANQFTHNIFSSNFLVPFFALQFGLAQAGLFKLLSHITYTVTMIMRKIFGWASDTMLAHTKNLELSDKQDMFHNINNKINNIMLALVIFLTINLTKIINYTNTPQNIINWPLIYFFLAITLIENLFISYEKFYIAEEENSIILLINAFSVISLSCIIFYSHFFEQLGQSARLLQSLQSISEQYWQYIMLFLIIATRALFFFILASISYYKWRIKPKFMIKPIYLIISLIISLAVFKFL